MGHLVFGQLYKISRVAYYRMSPFEQRAFAGAVSKGVPNMIRRVREQIFRVVPPFVATYLIYDWGEKEAHRLARKNPADFENEEE